ncbi:MAG: CDP-diacylglycerol--glycerol-3-phosphate 3-phosphatidyltransferase [Clostridia bacterium]|nr:CDP-diacylglycerol--glycerol-3-phosphate 3-phosphatidyltransferase [Clostridia bacterium]
MKKSVLNVPNTLSLIRVLLVPAFVCALIFMRDIAIWGKVVPALIFVVTALTDMLDGKIARKYNLVTDFGKFIDPLADKFMVIGSQVAILTVMLLEGEGTLGIVFSFVVLIILLRELGVTSLRLMVAGKSGIVVAASMLGKIKTVSQMVGTVIIILEPVVFPFCAQNHIIAYVCMAVMAFTTLFSGIDYLKAYMPYIDTNK